MVREIPQAVRDEIAGIVARVPDPTLRAIEVAMFVEDAFGMTLPSDLLDPADEDTVTRILLAVESR